MYKFRVAPIVGPVKSVFPLDMLMYDQCWPTSEGINQLVFVLSKDSAVIYDDLPIELASAKKPTPDRWRSFGWVVMS